MPANEISGFYVTGISYKKTDAGLRGQFALNTPADFSQFYALAAKAGISECFVISTCNRTEIYGFAPSATILAEVLCNATEGTSQQFDDVSYAFNGTDAVKHLFRVAAGLDSQLLGDYEIIGQIKNCVRIAKSSGFIGASLERLVNEVVRATKKIRTNTAFSSGTISVSFAAVQLIRDYFSTVGNKKILLIGTGKIGRHTCKNMVDYLPGAEITLMNRTAEKAMKLANEFNLGFASFENLCKAVNAADAIIVATASHQPILNSDHFTGASNKLIIDLSIPFNVDPSVAGNSDIRLVSVDELSRIKDETLQKRKAEIPVVESIIENHLQEFLQWQNLRRHAPVLQAVKSTLHSLCTEDSDLDDQTEERIQKLIKGVAVKIREENKQGCHYFEAINHFMSPSSGN